jgi:hypothetical protein
MKMFCDCSDIAKSGATGTQTYCSILLERGAPSDQPVGGLASPALACSGRVPPHAACQLAELIGTVRSIR